MVQDYITLNAQRFLETGQVEIKVYLSGGQVNILRLFYPCSRLIMNPQLTANIRNDPVWQSETY